MQYFCTCDRNKTQLQHMSTHDYDQGLLYSWVRNIPLHKCHAACCTDCPKKLTFPPHNSIVQVGYIMLRTNAVANTRVLEKHVCCKMFMYINCILDIIAPPELCGHRQSYENSDCPFQGGQFVMW